MTLAEASDVTTQLHCYAPDVLELVSHCLHALERLFWSAQTPHRRCPHHKCRPARRPEVSKLANGNACLAQHVSLST